MHLEELTDEVEQKMKLERPDHSADQAPSSSPGVPAADSSEATKPALPPARAATQGKTVDEVFAELNKSPLFMTELEENDDIAALQALAYEGSPLENAEDFRERGNECFRVRGYVDAREFYDKGVAILAAEEVKRARGEVTKNPEGVPDDEDEIARQREALEAMYVNRAACHLELSNFRTCWLDCAAALRINPRNLKACYRSARALLAVDRIEEADDVCARGLTLDPSNSALQAVARDIVQRATERDARRKEEAERQATAKRRALLRKAALRARGIATRTTAQPPEMEDARVALVPDEDDPRSALSFPAVLLYPLALESDFIKGFVETQTLGEHLAYVFPLPWDRERRYTAEAVECYVETREGGLLKMGRRVPLLKVLATGKVEVVDEVVRIFVLPRDGAEAWVNKFKAQKAAVMGKAA